MIMMMMIIIIIIISICVYEYLDKPDILWN